jgi:hypothetical protein
MSNTWMTGKPDIMRSQVFRRGPPRRKTWDTPLSASSGSNASDGPNRSVRYFVEASIGTTELSATSIVPTLRDPWS